VLVAGIALAAGPRIGGHRAPIRRVRIVGQDPGAAGIHALQHDAQPGDQFLAAEIAILAERVLDLATQRRRVELRLQPQHPPSRAPEHDRGEIEIEALDVLHRVAHRERGRNDRAGRGAADEIEIVAEPHLLLEVLGQHLLDLLEEGDRDRAAYAAAVECKDAFRAGAEQMAVARAGGSGRFVHRIHPQ
jgi:hypothetical protein